MNKKILITATALIVAAGGAWLVSSKARHDKVARWKKVPKEIVGQIQADKFSADTYKKSQEVTLRSSDENKKMGETLYKLALIQSESSQEKIRVLRMAKAHLEVAKEQEVVQ